MEQEYQEILEYIKQRQRTVNVIKQNWVHGTKIRHQYEGEIHAYLHLEIFINKMINRYVESIFNSKQKRSEELDRREIFKMAKVNRPKGVKRGKKENKKQSKS